MGPDTAMMAHMARAPLGLARPGRATAATRPCGLLTRHIVVSHQGAVANGYRLQQGAAAQARRRQQGQDQGPGRGVSVQRVGGTLIGTVQDHNVGATATATAVLCGGL